MDNTVTLKSVLDLLQNGGPSAALLVFIWAGMTGRIVYGWQYRDLQKRERMWQQLALEGTRIGERGTRIAEKTLASGSALSEDGDTP